ncbi:MAG: hypothetical protein PF961_19645 [Planctomycetota bacterium]|jgi:hypothetical protein|nr:hypothetical protein [Planctomycetota bacterium]
MGAAHEVSGFTDAAAFGFAPEASASVNVAALQLALDQGGTVVVSQPGTYDLNATVLIGSNTGLRCAQGVVLRKCGDFSHVLLNRGALSKSWDHHIVVEGLHIAVNGVDKVFDEIYGLRGQIAFFYVSDLRIERFRCYDLESQQFCIHVCTFEDLIVDDVIIHGAKDGVHLGRGKRFAIRNCVFATTDDAVALNAHDYATSNPELGWIEDGVVENCHDLADEGKIVGFFCRFLAGSWGDWRAGMEVQHSDSVVSEGRVYRVQAKPDGTLYTSQTQPTHTNGSAVLDGINWGVVQNDVQYVAGVRNVTMRGIFLHKARTAFSMHFDAGRYSRGYYPGSAPVSQDGLRFEGVRVLHESDATLLNFGTPADVVSFSNCDIGDHKVRVHNRSQVPAGGASWLRFQGCTFRHAGPHTGPHAVVELADPGRDIHLRVTDSAVLSADYQAEVTGDLELLDCQADLPGLC